MYLHLPCTLPLLDHQNKSNCQKQTNKQTHVLSPSLYLALVGSPKQIHLSKNKQTNKQSNSIWRRTVDLELGA